MRWVLFVLSAAILACGGPERPSENTSTDPADSQNNRIVTRDGVSLRIPPGWRLTSDRSMEPLATIYSAENRNGALFSFYRLRADIAMTALEFAEMMEEDRAEEISNHCSCIVLNLELDASARSTANRRLSGYKQSYYVKNLLPPRDSVQQTQEFYHYDIGDERVIITAMGEDSSSDTAELAEIFTSLRFN